MLIISEINNDMLIMKLYIVWQAFTQLSQEILRLGKILEPAVLYELVSSKEPFYDELNEPMIMN